MPTFEQIMGWNITPEQQQKVATEMERLNLSAESVVPFGVQQGLGEIKPFPIEAFKPPTVDIKSPTTDILTATTGIDAKLNAMLADIETRQKQFETEKTRAETEQKGIVSKVGEFFAGRKPTEEVLAGLETKYQIPETLTLQKQNLETMKSLRESIIGLQTEQMKAQATLEARAGVPRGIMGAQIAELEKQYAIRQAPLSANLSALGAYDEALRGNITQATQLMRNYIEAATYEDNIKMKEFEFLLENNKGIIANLDISLRNALNDRMDLLKTSLAVKQNETEQIAKLVTDNPQANWQGFDFAKGTLEDAMNVVATAPTPSIELKEEVVGGFRILRDATGKVIATREISAPTGTTTTGIRPIFTQTQINKGAQTANMPIEDFKTLEENTQNYFISGASEIAKAKKVIDESFKTKENPQDLEKEISESGLPDAVKDTLVRYLWSVFPKDTETRGVPFWEKPINWLKSVF